MGPWGRDHVLWRVPVQALPAGRVNGTPAASSRLTTTVDGKGLMCRRATPTSGRPEPARRPSGVTGAGTSTVSYAVTRGFESHPRYLPLRGSSVARGASHTGASIASSVWSEHPPLKRRVLGSSPRRSTTPMTVSETKSARPVSPWLGLVVPSDVPRRVRPLIERSTILPGARQLPVSWASGLGEVVPLGRG